MIFSVLCLLAYATSLALAWKCTPTRNLQESLPRIITPLNISENDTTLLNYALAVENLQSAFYQRALSEFDENAFNASGLPRSVRDGYVLIARNKQSQIALLSHTLGINATSPCNYTFPFTNVTSFIQLSQTMEDIGTSAYIGIMPGLKNSTHITAAASILAANARYASWIGSSVTKVRPWSGPFDPPLIPDQVISLAVPCVSSCPSTNAQLPFRAFPTFTLAPNDGCPGSNISVITNSALPQGPLYAAFLQGLDQTIVPLMRQNNNNMVTLPANLSGTVFVLLTNNSQIATNETIVAGPNIITYNFPFNETVKATVPLSSVPQVPTNTVVVSTIFASQATPSFPVVSTIYVSPSTSQVVPTSPSVAVSTVYASPPSPTTVATATAPVSTVVVTATA